MSDSTGFRRSLVVILLAVALAAAPMVPAWASTEDGSDAQAAPADEGGVVQQIVDWLIEVMGAAGSSEPNENGDTGGGFDPMG